MKGEVYVLLPTPWVQAWGMEREPALPLLLLRAPLVPW